MNVAPLSILVGEKHRWEALTWTADKTKVSIGTHKDFAVGVLSQNLRTMFRKANLVIHWGSQDTRSQRREDVPEVGTGVGCQMGRCHEGDCMRKQSVELIIFICQAVVYATTSI